MKDGFIKVSAGTLEGRVADTAYNSIQIINRIMAADAYGSNVLVLPELCLSSAGCGDLFFSSALQNACCAALDEIRQATAELYPLVIAGAPLKHKGRLYNCAVAMLRGEFLAAVPKCMLSSDESRHFASGLGIENESIKLCGREIPFGSDILLQHDEIADYCLGIEMGSESAAPCSPAETLALGGAVIIACPGAEAETIGASSRRRALLTSSSARLCCGYVYAGAGTGESSQDRVYSGHCLICENGRLPAENLPFGHSMLPTTDIDILALSADRQRNPAMSFIGRALRSIAFSQKVRETQLSRAYPKSPFVPADYDEMHARAEETIVIQAQALKRRMQHIGCKSAVIGISGGLDSTLALLVTVRAFDLMNKNRRDILCVTMPCFGTTDRTRSNAEKLCQLLGVSLRTVEIGESVKQHLKDISHDIEQRNVTYENAQARERTQVLMDIANDAGGIVIGTGDLSELALGWATYNGDHMSMYGVNASIPKTMVRAIVRHEAKLHPDMAVKDVLIDIMETPVSPELLPASSQGEIAQRTEELVGPYELHDFFLYYMLRFGFAPGKLLRIAKETFSGLYSEDTIKKWLSTFIRRFFSQQFKRSCLPDGPGVGSVGLSPRDGWHMPSDAVCSSWLRELDDMEKEQEKQASYQKQKELEDISELEELAKDI